MIQFQHPWRVLGNLLNNGGKKVMTFLRTITTIVATLMFVVAIPTYAQSGGGKQGKHHHHSTSVDVSKYNLLFGNCHATDYCFTAGVTEQSDHVWVENGRTNYGYHAASSVVTQGYSEARYGGSAQIFQESGGKLQFNLKFAR